jgi:DNA-binding beta-propeller fold protein YncE
MSRTDFARIALAAMLATGALGSAAAQTKTQLPSDLPDPYRTGERWGSLPDGRSWGQVATVQIDRDGKSVWVVERCGAKSCVGSSLAPILKFDAAGRLVASFGGGLSVMPHGLFIDRDDNVWFIDADGKDGKGHQVFKFSPDGKILLRLGQAGVAGDGPGQFNRPSAVVVAPDGDIFVADGHGGDSNARIVKFAPDGRFIKAWGRKGTGPGELDGPHALAMDSRGRLFVADRGNDRVQIFDQEGGLLGEWRQFGRPSGVYIDANDMLYVTDSQTKDASCGANPACREGVRIGSAKDGVVRFYVPDPLATVESSFGEGVAADASGILYVSEVAKQGLRRYARQ